MQNNRVGIYSAHDDDSILGIGGRLIQHIKNGDLVHVVIFTEGRTSHKSVLGIENNPSPSDVSLKRKEEIRNAMAIMGVSKNNLISIKLTKGDGRVSENINSAREQIDKIVKDKIPNIIYYHYPDAHPDHRLVNKIMEETVKKNNFIKIAYQYIIWSKELASNYNNLDIDEIKDLPRDAIEIDISEELELKRKALWEMRSQVDIWPYWNWQIQERPIINKSFLEHFLRGKEILIKVS